MRLFFVTVLSTLPFAIALVASFHYATGRNPHWLTRFANTHAFLPKIHGIRPDTLHVIFHAALIATLALLAMLTFRDHASAFS